MAYPPILFQSVDTGAGVMKGQAGALTDILNQCLIVKNVFVESESGAFEIGKEDGSGSLLKEGGSDLILQDIVLQDKTTQARTQATAASDDFLMFLSPATTDRIYVGMQVKFGRMFFTLGVNGTNDGVYVVEYWNGSAWTAVSDLADGTSGLTASGVMTWTIPTDWTTVSVAGTTDYWVRIRPSTAPATSPQITTLTVTGWSQRFVGTNKYVYQQGGGSMFFMRIRDDAAHATALGKEAQYRWFETIADIDAAVNSGPMPTNAQSVLTNNSLIIRKSSLTTSVAALWALVADDRTFYLAISTGDNGAGYYGCSGGDFYSAVGGDAYRVFMIGRASENDGAVSADTTTTGGVGNVATGGHYIIRPYTGALGAVTAQKFGGGAAPLSSLNSLGGQLTTAIAVNFPNPADAGFYFTPIWIAEGTGATCVIRGRLRGWMQSLHAVGAFADRDTIQGTGGLAGRTFMARVGNVQSSVSVNCPLAWDISPSTPWESN